MGNWDYYRTPKGTIKGSMPPVLTKNPEEQEEQSLREQERSQHSNRQQQAMASQAAVDGVSEARGPGQRGPSIAAGQAHPGMPEPHRRDLLQGPAGFWGLRGLRDVGGWGK